MVEILGQCFDGLRNYGKTPDQLENVTKLFLHVLAPYPAEAVIAAFTLYASRSGEMPAPADIVKIIKRGNKPPFDSALYIELSKKRERTQFREGNGVYDCLTIEEGEYMREYERDAMGVKP